MTMGYRAAVAESRYVLVPRLRSKRPAGLAAKPETKTGSPGEEPVAALPVSASDPRERSVLLCFCHCPRAVTGDAVELEVSGLRAGLHVVVGVNGQFDAPVFRPVRFGVVRISGPGLTVRLGLQAAARDAIGDQKV